MPIVIGFFSLFAFVMWIVAIVHDANHNMIVWALIDFFAFPVGIIHGIAVTFF